MATVNAVTDQLQVRVTGTLTAAATSTVTFFAEADGDVPIEKVRYYLSKKTLYRGITNAAGSPPSYSGQPESTSTISTYIMNSTSTPIFRYYDENGAELSVPIDTIEITSIQVKIQSDLNPNRAPYVFELSGSATLRNLRSQ